MKGVRKKLSELLVVALNGSPHKTGNTAFLLNEAISVCMEMGAEVEQLHCQSLLKTVNSPFCVACSSPCSGKCYADTKLGEALNILAKADAIIVGSPVYFGTVAGQIKAFWDRTRLLRTNKSLINVVGAAISSGASRFGGQENTINAIHDMFLVQGMLIVGDGHNADNAGHFGCASQRPSAEDVYAINRAKILGKRIIEVANATKRLRNR